jgi:hypothetical protein
MAKKVRIKYIVFSESETSFGLELLFAVLREQFDVHASKFDPGRPDISDSDFLFVSLIWWEDLLEFVRIQDRLSIHPGIRPKIVVGGSAFNPHLLAGRYDAGVLGDGEVVICDLVDKYLSEHKVDDIPGVVTASNIGESKLYRVNQVVPPYLHTEIRRSAIPRIEIARGCKHKCPFCQVAHMKPYRELPTEIVLSLCRQVKGKSVGLFAPDRCDHSGFEKIQKTLKRWRKRDSSRDARFDSLSKFDVVDGGLTLGLEGFTESGRKLNRKAGRHDDVVSYFDMIFNRLKNSKGEPITTCQVYMILDLPTERNGNPFDEFEILLRDINALCNRKFTLFLVANTFSAKAFTKFSHEGIDLYSPMKERWNSLSAIGGEMKIAKRGGFLAPPRRIVQAICDRGDERLSGLLKVMATKGRKHLNSWNRGVVRELNRQIRSSEWDPDDVYGKTEKELWFDSYEIEKLRRDAINS